MNVLSLFDGMSCGQQALERLGFQVANYYASEIDKYAIQVTQHNYPNTKQLGSVVDVDARNLPKIDLLIGGSPCQSFSFAGKMKGMSTKDEQEILTLDHYLKLKEEGFEFEGQSYLFWEYMRILHELREKNPNVYFLLENVKMSKKWEDVLSKAIGVKGIHINSALVSAQNRKRIYWTNIGLRPSSLLGDLESIIEQPKDKGILLKDILESDVDDKYFLSPKAIDRINRTDGGDRCFDNSSKAMCLKMGYFKQGRDNQFVVAMRGRPNEDGVNVQQLEPRHDDKTNCLTSVSKDNLLFSNKEVVDQVGCVKFGRTEEAKQIRKQHMANGVDYTPFSNKEIVGLDFDKMNTLTTAPSKDNLVMQINPSLESNGKQPYQQNRVYHTEGISPALCANKSDLIVYGCDFRTDEGIRKNKNGKSFALRSQAGGKLQGKGVLINSNIRRLTPIECERLQTVKDNYTSCVSDTQRYKMLGNGWTVDVICHILNYLKTENEGTK